VDAMKEQGRTLGIPDRDLNDMVYAIVAFMDEIALSSPDGLRSYWMGRSLQLHYFGENIAGEGFFSRLHTLQSDGRRFDVLRVYSFCLLLGFQGKYAYPGGDVELMRISDTLRNQLERQTEIPDLLSPSGEPPDEPLVQKANSNFLLWVSLGVLAIAFSVFIGLRISFNQKVVDVNTRVEKLVP
jgi:type VI secretion system protein ImpK